METERQNYGHTSIAGDKTEGNNSRVGTCKGLLEGRRDQWDMEEMEETGGMV